MKKAAGKTNWRSELKLTGFNRSYHSPSHIQEKELLHYGPSLSHWQLYNKTTAWQGLEVYAANAALKCIKGKCRQLSPLHGHTHTRKTCDMWQGWASSRSALLFPKVRCHRNLTNMQRTYQAPRHVKRRHFGEGFCCYCKVQQVKKRNQTQLN